MLINFDVMMVMDVSMGETHMYLIIISYFMTMRMSISIKLQ